MIKMNYKKQSKLLLRSVCTLLIIALVIPMISLCVNAENHEKMSEIRFRALALGYDHSAAIAENGDLYCWGHNQDGQLGTGLKEDINTPTKIMSGVSEVFLGMYQTAVITTGGDLYIWGCNTYANVGDGTTTDRTSPVKVLSDVRQFCFGDNYNCAAVTKSGDLFVWGNASAVASGRENTYCGVPTKILGNIEFVSLGSAHGAAISTNGDLFVWGSNDCGQVGTGENAYQLTPKRILSNVQLVDLSHDNSAAVTTGGNLYVWGDNRWGTVGDGTEDNKDVPTKVLDKVMYCDLGNEYVEAITSDGELHGWGYDRNGLAADGIKNVKSVIAGENHLAVLKDDAGLYVCGYNIDGAVGIGEAGTYVSYPKKVLSAVCDYALGEYHTGAICEDGSLYMWGRNEYGQVGNANTSDQTAPCKINVYSESLSDSPEMSDNEMKDKVVFSYVTCGGSHTAAISTKGNLYVWGRGDHGEIGNGTVENQPFPQKILEQVSYVCIGFSHTAAITESGDLYVWGDNTCGQVGNGASVMQTTPAKVLSNVRSVTIDDDRTAAITNNGDLYIWGRNNFGEVGNGRQGNQTVPVKVMENVSEVAIGSNFTVAVTNTGDMYCWGSNNKGQLGNRNVKESLEPLLILSNVTSVNVDGYTAFALTSDNVVYAWGNNAFCNSGTGGSVHAPIWEPFPISRIGLSFGKGTGIINLDKTLLIWGTNTWGQIGNGTTKDQPRPTEVLSDVVSFSRDDHSIAITNNGTLFGWGQNDEGQVGNATTDNQMSPTRILNDIVDADIGFSHTAAISSSGELYVWGSNNYGEIGNGAYDNQLNPYKVVLEEDKKQSVNENGDDTSADNRIELGGASTLATFNAYFVDNYYNNILELSMYESVAKGIAHNSSNFQINWNAYLSGLSDKNFIDLSKLSVNLHYYYEVALLEAIMQTKLNDDYISALTSQVGALTIEALSFYVKYDANFNNYEDILKTKIKDTMPYFRTDSSEFLRIKNYYGRYCRQLDNYEVVKGIYDMTTEMDGSVEDFFNALSNYTGVRQASNEILSALKYLRSDLEKSSVEEDRFILQAVNNLILAFESDLDRQLVINTLKTTQDQLWNVFYSAMGIAFADLDLTLTVADFSIDTALTLSNVIFPTTISSTSYCKIYADLAIETVMQRAMLSAYDEYLISPSQDLADTIMGMYDLLGYIYSHEIEVGTVLSEQLHKDGLINGLKNVFSDRNSKVYEYEQECIRAYNAYLKDIQKVKVEALETYGLAVGRLQPVVTVYFVNGKVVAVNEVSIETGTLYDVSSGGFKLPEFTNLCVEIGGYYTNEEMTILYNESKVVNGPITLYCDLLLLKQSDGTPILFDHSTGICVTRNEEGNHTVLNTSKITDGEYYESVKEYFRGKEIDLYDISLVQGGSTIQPPGEVVVEIPVDGKRIYKKIGVYRIEADGTYTDMDATYDKQTCRFATTHFSKYVVVYENAVSMWCIALIVVIAVFCVTVIGVFLAKKKKR